MKYLLILLALSTFAMADSIPVSVVQPPDQVLLGVDFIPVVGPSFSSDILCFAFDFLPDSQNDIPWSATMTLGGIVYQTSGLLTDIQLGPNYQAYVEFLELPKWYHGAMGQLDFYFGPQYSRPLPFEYFTPVPEPGTIFLLSTGILLTYRKMRRTV